MATLFSSIFPSIRKNLKQSERQRRDEYLDDKRTNVKVNEEKHLQDATNEAIKEVAKKKSVDKTKVDDLIAKSNRVIMEVSSVFPFEFFPTRIIVEETKLIVIFNFFFATSQSHTIDIKDITNVFVGKGPIFASLEIVSRTYIENNIIVKKLWRKDAVNTHHMIEGLRTFCREKVDTSTFEESELIQKLKALANTEVA